MVWRAFLLVLALAISGALFWGWHDFNRFSNTPLPMSPQRSSVDVDRGASFRSIVGQLQQDRCVLQYGLLPVFAIDTRKRGMRMIKAMMETAIDA